MEIIVQGNGTEYFTPNEVILNISFNTVQRRQLLIYLHQMALNYLKHCIVYG